MNSQFRWSERKNSLLTFFSLILSFLVLFTFMQNYYSVFLHLAIFVCCLFSMKYISKEQTALLVLGIVSALIMAFLARNRAATTPIQQIGFFLHYLTWPILLGSVDEQLSRKQKLLILRTIIVVCIIGNLASLSVLLTNNEVSRILASSSQVAKDYYYALGVGGYGYVYAMAFLTYGAIVWLINARSPGEKALLIVYLITNYFFILFASYTIAIILTLVLTLMALTTKMYYKKAKTALILFLVLILVFRESLITIGISVADHFDLTWVSDRLSRLLDVQTTGDYGELKRSKLYLRSINSFLTNPIFGAGTVGGHSQILDSFGNFGIFATLSVFLLYRLAKFCRVVSRHRNLLIFFLTFFVFATIDTCSAMQIPIIVFFVCPLILKEKAYEK